MKTRKIGAILLIIAMVLTMMPLSAMAATATAIKFEKTSEMKAEVGKSYKREAVTTPEGAAVAYSSSNTKIVTVDSKTGRVTAIAEGKAVITAKSGKVTASYTVVVSKASGATASTKTQKPVPKEGYKEIWECAEAHPGYVYYTKFFISNGLGYWRWFPISKSSYEKYTKEGFASIEDLYAVMGDGLRGNQNVTQNPKTGRWGFLWSSDYSACSIPFLTTYYATVEAIAKEAPDAVTYKYVDKSVGWITSTDVNDGYIYTAYGNQFSPKPYDSKAEAEAVAESIIGYSQSTSWDRKNYTTTQIVSSKVYQNKYTGKWFVGFKTQQIGTYQR